MNIRKLLPALALALALSGCGLSLNASAHCSGGPNGSEQCTGNYSQSSGAPSAIQTSAPAPSSAPSPTVTVTVTASPLPQPEVTQTVTDFVDIVTCYPEATPDAGYLDSLSDDTQELGQLALCLQIPQGNVQVFENQVQVYVSIAAQSGLFSTQAGRYEFSREPGEITCPDGQQVYSLTQIYDQYQ